MGIDIRNKPGASGYIFALCSTAIWSGNFIIARGLNQSISPLGLAFWRWCIASLAILPFALPRLKAGMPAIKRSLPYLAFTSFLGVTLFNTLIYYAGRSTSAINLSLISITFPIFIVLMSRIFFKDPLTIRKGAGIFLVAVGVVVLITKGKPEKILHIDFALGDLLMLFAAITFASYSILLRRKPKDLDSTAFQSATFTIGTLFLLPLYLFDLKTAAPVTLTPTLGFAILYVSLLASLLAFFMWGKSVESIGPSKAGVLYYTMPLFSGLWSFLFLGEAIGIAHVASLACIVPGILIANSEKKP
jgi:drug/metabolite transporter (DMT)-like permease